MKIIYTVSGQPVDGDEVIEDILEKAPLSTYEQILGEPPVEKEPIEIGKTLLRQILLTVAQCMADKLSIVKIIRKIKDKHGVALDHETVRLYKKKILKKYREKILAASEG